MNRKLQNRIFRLCLFAIVTLVMGSLWSCGSSKSATKQKAHTSTGKVDKKPNKKRPLPAAATLPVQKALVTNAREWLGTPYVYGGQDRKGADCSGFIMAVFRDAAGMKLPRNSAAQKDFCIELNQSKMEVGDLVFFSSPRSGNKIAHVGMYVGDGMMIHASSSRGVVESDLSQNYYVKHFRGVGRVPAIAQAIPVKSAPAPARKPDAEIEERQLTVTPPTPTPAPKPAPSALPEPEPAPAPVAVAVSEQPVVVIIPETKAEEKPVAAAPFTTSAPETNVAAAPEEPKAEPQQTVDPESMVAKAFGRK